MYVSMIRLCILWEADKSVRDELSKSFLGNVFTGSTSRSLFFVVTCPPSFPYRVPVQSYRVHPTDTETGHWVLIVTHITPVTVVSNATLSFYWSLNHFDVHDNIPYLHQSTCLCLEESTRQSSVQLDAYGR